MEEIPENIRKIAHDLAMWHGSKITLHRDGENLTVAAQHGYGSWGHSPTRYADNHWRAYTAAAEYVAEAILAERERCARVCEFRADALTKIKGYRSEVAELRARAIFIRSGE